MVYANLLLYWQFSEPSNTDNSASALVLGGHGDPASPPPESFGGGSLATGPEY